MSPHRQLHVTLPGWLKALYPFRPQSFTNAHGARMSYIDTGAATTPPNDTAVLMLHGNPTWSFYYRELIAALAPDHRCIAPDHIGMGLSEKPENYPYTLSTRINDIAQLVRWLGLKKIHLVVHDWGGAVGFGLAASMPTLVERITILNTAAFPSPHIPARIALCKTPYFGTFLIRAFNAFAGPATWMSMHRRKLTKDEKRAFLFPYQSWKTRVAINAFVKDIPMKPSDRSFPTLQSIANFIPRLQANPVQIIWGGKDFCFNQHFLAEWRRLLPAAEVHNIPDAGHYVLADASEEVIPKIKSFLG